MLCALIMAGGKGTRFWPLSTEEKPKQFLKLLGKETMIQMSVNRLKKLIPMERIFVVTAKKYTSLVKEQLPEISEKNIIVEPVGKNTAPCIALSAFMIEKQYKDATIVVLPSDHLIIDEEKFRQTVQAGYEFVNKNKESIVTLGMKPNRPETGYGYIEMVVGSGQCTVNNNAFKVYKVNKFVEKPNLEKAKEYLKEGNFLWNGGMFIWKGKNILKLTHEYLNNTYKVLSEIVATREDNFEEVLEKKYETVESVSVDYGIMEKADNIYVIPSDFGWDDIGTWYAVERYRKKDEYGNVCVGDIKTIDGSNSIVVGNKKPIVMVGLDDVFVVESDDVILIGNKDNIRDIKEIRNKVL